MCLLASWLADSKKRLKHWARDTERHRKRERQWGEMLIYINILLYVWWIIKVLHKEVSESWIVLASWWTSLSPLWLHTHTNMLHGLSSATHSILRSSHFQTTYCRSSSELISYTEPLPPFLLILTRKVSDIIYQRKHQLLKTMRLPFFSHCKQIPWTD